jgi:protocatechuate 3,4-dioxygenase beta subunit
MRLPRGAVISGTILDDKGAPLSQVGIRVMRYMYMSGERRLGPVNSMTTGPDERGQYRVFDLAPGDYYVVATPLNGPFRGNADLHLTSDVDVEQAALTVSEGRGAPVADVAQRSVTIAPVYYPGVYSPAQATQVSLHAGEERSGVDFALTYVASVHVEGSVTGLDGAPAPGATITLVNNDPNAGLFGFDAIRNVRTDANGHFSFAAVTPGVYVFSARTSTGWALSDVDVQGDDIHGLSVALQESFSVSGTIRVEGAANAPPLSNVRVNLTPQVSGNGVVVSSGLGVNADADGHFTIKGVSPGRYRLNASLQGPRPLWTMRSSMLGGQDALDAFVDVRQGLTDAAVVFTDQLANLYGHTAPDSSVILFSTNQAHWYPQSRRVLLTRAAGDGIYTFRNVPPGEYFVAAVDDVEPGRWNDPSYLQGLAPAAQKITIAEGEKKTIDLRASGG